MNKIVLLFCCLCFSVAVVSAQEIQTVSPEKAALIKELLELTSAKKNALSAFDTLLEQNEKRMPDIIWEAVAGTGELGKLSAKEQDELKKVISASSTRVATKMRAMFLERVDFGQTIDEVYYPLFDKYFTSGELTELNAFYRTPLGKKSIELFPKIYGEAAQRASDMISPKVTAIMGEIMKTEQPAMQKEIDRIVKEREAKPTGTKTTSRKSQKRQ